MCSGRSSPRESSGHGAREPDEGGSTTDRLLPAGWRPDRLIGNGGAMADLAVDERLFLLSRSACGRDRSLTGINTPLAAATLVVLEATGAIEVVEGRVVVPGAEPPRRHLRIVRDVVADSRRTRSLPYWLGRLPRAVRLQENVGSSLAERLVVGDRRRSRLGVPIREFPPADLGLARGVQRDVHEVLAGADTEPDPMGRLLAGLVGSAGLIASVVEPVDRRLARRRAGQFLGESAIGAAAARCVTIEWNCPRARLAGLAQLR